MKTPRRSFLFLCASLCILISVVNTPSAAQQGPYFVTHRPPHVRYDVLQTPRFEIIFQRGLDSVAVEAGLILEGAVPVVKAVTGLERTLRMPVVINNYNDLSNAFVRVAPFKQEIELPRIKSKTFTATNHTWLDEVLLHELTHGAHAEINPGFGIGGLAGLMGPDFRRMINFSTPAGFSEGVAVYAESITDERHGRLNNAFFNMQYRAAVGARGGWNLAQIATVPLYTHPADRFYIGGGHLFSYLYEQYDADFFRNTARFYNRLPILGYGTALWVGLRRAPWRMARDFRRTERERERQRVAELGTLTRPQLRFGGEGHIYRRPRWLDDGRLVVQLAGYHTRRGFYTLDLNGGRRDLLSHDNVTEDLFFSVSPGGRELLFSRYVPHLTADGTWTAGVFSVDTETGRTRTVLLDERLFAPVRAPDGALWAVQNWGQFTRWVRIEAAGEVSVLMQVPRFSFLELAPRPNTNEVAILGNVDGRQSIHRTAMDDDGAPGVLDVWIGFDDASVFDIGWSRDGRYLVFSADRGGVLNVYAFDTGSELIHRLTNVAYGALEPAFSPDGSRIAYVSHDYERFNLDVIGFDPNAAFETFRAPVVTAPASAGGDTEVESTEPFRMTGAYRAFPRFLRPRIAIPIAAYGGPGSAADTRLGWALGAYTAGTDPLQTWSYTALAYYQQRRLWGDFRLEYGRPVFRPYLGVYSEPFVATLRRVDAEGRELSPVRAVFEERGARLGARMPLRLDVNVFSTTASLALQGSLRQVRHVTGGGTGLGTFSTRATLQPAAAFGYRLQANRRDIVPNSGLVLRTSARLDVWTDGAPPSRWWYGTSDLYLPVWLSRSHALRVFGGVLVQNEHALFTGLLFTPRGFEDLLTTAGRSYVRAGFEYVLPIQYVDNGFFFVPAFLHGAHLYAGLDARTSLAGPRETATSVGGGIAFRMRLFYHVPVELRIGTAYLIERREWRPTVR